jgi:hypothetical protein
MLGSRMAAERAAGVHTLTRICEKMGDSNRKLCEIQTAVVEAGGIPLLVRVLESRGTTVWFGRRLRGARARVVQHGCQASVCRGWAGVIPPLTALLSSSAADVQPHALLFPPPPRIGAAVIAFGRRAAGAVLFRA